jgi:DNA-binding HxlR family transcriptional regulator
MLRSPDRRRQALEEDTAADYGPGSPTRLALDRIAHKWTPLIVWALKSGPLPFTALRAAVPGVTSQVLTHSLRDLERDGIVERRYFPEAPPRVEYELLTSDSRCAHRSPPSGHGLRSTPTQSRPPGPPMRNPPVFADVAGKSDQRSLIYMDLRIRLM